MQNTVRLYMILYLSVRNPTHFIKSLLSFIFLSKHRFSRLRKPIGDLENQSYLRHHVYNLWIAHFAYSPLLQHFNYLKLGKMRRSLTLIIANYQRHHPPDDEEIASLVSELQEIAMLDPPNIPSDIDGVLGLISTRLITKGI